MQRTPEVIVLESWSERELNGPRRSFSLEVRGEAVWLRADDQAWPLNDPDLTFGFESIAKTATSRFVIARAGREEFVFLYRHFIRSVMSRLDPTHDALDVALEHPLLVVAEQSRSTVWHQALLNRARSGRSAA